jgi:hypothetical protein
MNQKDLIKYGLMLVAGYLVYKYVQDHGGFSALLGQALPAPAPAPGAPAPGATPPGDAPPPARASASLDLTGLVVVKDINNSLTGTVKINGVPVRLAIIQTDGRIFDGSGAEVTQALTDEGVDIAKLRQAFAAAGAGLAGYSQRSYGAPVWLM